MVHYGFSKAAQLVIARGAAETTKGTNVTVNSVLPGPTWVEMAPVRLAARAKGLGTTAEELAARTFTERRPQSLLQRYAVAGGDRQPHLLRLLQGLERHQRCRAPRRRRHRHQPVLTREAMVPRDQVSARRTVMPGLVVRHTAACRTSRSPRRPAIVL